MIIILSGYDPLTQGRDYAICTLRYVDRLVGTVNTFRYSAPANKATLTYTAIQNFTNVNHASAVRHNRVHIQMKLLYTLPSSK